MEAITVGPGLVPDVEPDATRVAAHDLAAICDEQGWTAPIVAWWVSWRRYV